MKSLLFKENNIKNKTIKLLLCTLFIYLLMIIIPPSPSQLRKMVKSHTNQYNVINMKKYEISEIDIAKIADIESKSIYAKRKPKKKPRNPASDEGREMMANNNYHQVKEKV